MTQNSKLKKLARERMAKTGEKYTEARRAVLAEHEAKKKMQALQEKKS